MKTEQLKELVLQSLEHEMGGVRVYTAAIASAQHEELKEEWRKYLEQTRMRVQTLRAICKAVGVEAERETLGRRVVRHRISALVESMKLAEAAGDREAAERVACECIVLAETKNHVNWELLGRCAQKVSGAPGAFLKEASDEFERQEHQHLYETKGWWRELWLKSLGLQSILSREDLSSSGEGKNVTSAIGAVPAE
jgi:uncharacterized protein YhaN